MAKSLGVLAELASLKQQLHPQRFYSFHYASPPMLGQKDPNSRRAKGSSLSRRPMAGLGDETQRLNSVSRLKNQVWEWKSVDWSELFDIIKYLAL